MDQCQRSRKTALPADKKDLPMTIGGQRWPGEWVFGVRPPQRGPSDGARITIRGKIKWPRLPLSLNYTCKPPLYRPLQHLRNRQSAPLSQPLAATLIAYWLSLMTTAGHRNNSHWPRCQKSGEGRIKKGERVKRRERESWIRDRQQGKMCVFSFHHWELEENGGGKKCPCHNGSLWRCWEACGCHPPTLSWQIWDPSKLSSSCLKTMAYE